MSVSRLLSLKLAAALALLGAAVLLAYGIGQETPVGALKGSVVARESGAPLRADVGLTSVAKVDGEHLYYSAKSGKDGSFLLRSIPAGAYKLEIQSKAHHMKATKVIIAEGATETLEADLEPDQPSLDLYVHENVFTPGEAPQVTCHGFLDSETISLRVYWVDPDAFLLKANASLEKLIGGSSYMSPEEQSGLNLDTNRSLRLAHQEDVRITHRDIEGIFTQRMDLPVLAPGLYVVAVKSAGLQRCGWVMVTSLGLIAKTVGAQTLTYTVDLRTGEPVASSDISIFLDSRRVTSGKTDRDGIAHLSVPSSETGHPDEMIVARSGNSFAFITASFSSPSSTSRLIYTYTERPVYRPGQFVFYKGIVRDNINDTYKTPGRGSVVVEVRDPDDMLIYRGAKTTDKFGCYSGAIHLNAEAPTGVYSIKTTVNGESNEEDGVSFTVAAYRKPEFSVKATFDKKRYTRGEWVKAKVSVNYYFGSPVANATVSYTINRSAYWLFGDDDAMVDGYSDYGGYGEQVKYGDIRTDENGEATIEFPATWQQPKDNEGYDTDQEFSISLTATDKSGTEATGEGSVLVTRGEFAVEVQPDSYVTAPGKTVGVLIKAADYEHHPVANQDVSVTLSREQWSESGDYKLETLTKKQVTTDKNGRATAQLPVDKAGSLMITTRATDSRGNEIVSSNYVWSTGEIEDGSSDPNMQGLDIVLDKKTYSAGDKARVLILTNRPGVTALVTVEGSRIYDSRTVKLSGKSTLVEIPIKANYKPNFYVSVCGVYHKNFLRAEKGAKVSIKSEALNIWIEPSRKIYKPAQKADYRLKVTDSNGKPVSSELSVGVVDEAIYAIEPESTTPILDYFYAHRENAVQTYDSFPQIYLSDPDKAGAPLQNEPMKIRVRKRFLDTAYWGPSVITDSKGEARVSFDLPDNLTTWRATVRGVSADTLCGQATNTVIARQPLLVRLELPRFLVQGDRSVLTAVVHNYTGRDQRVRVRIRAPRLKVEDDIERNVLVRNDGSERIDWQVSAPKPGAFAVDVRAEGETAGDAVQLDLPVKPRGEENSTSTAAVVTGGSKSLSIPVRNDAIMEATQLRVRLAPSLASSVLGSLDYLAQYPYGCTEQTVSTFLPDVILLQSMKTLGLRNAKLEAQLPDMVHKGLSRLYRFQLTDGGWSWSQYGTADPWMTSYVCYALIRAREPGFSIDQARLESGLDALKKAVDSRKTYLYPHAFGCYTLALAGKDVSSELDALAPRRYLNNETLAAMALAYERLGKADKAKAILDRLFGKSIGGGDGIHWSGGYRYDGGDIEPTALALQAMLRITPGDPRIYDIVRWLMKSRRDDYWWSTRGTAMVLYGMADFLRTTKELAPNETVSVLVNGKSVGDVHFDKGSVYAPQTELTITAPNLRQGRNSVEIRKAGAGNVYYSSSLTQYIAKKSMPQLVSGAGLKVTRAYYSVPSGYNPYEIGQRVGSPISNCETGDTVLVRLTVYASTSFSHMLLEDSIPAGCEIMTRGDVSFDEWNYWWGGQDVRDDKISFYIDELENGKAVIDYRLRAGFAGNYIALPAQVFSMYDPAVRATTGSTEFSIR